MSGIEHLSNRSNGNRKFIKGKIHHEDRACSITWQEWRQYQLRKNHVSGAVQYNNRYSTLSRPGSDRCLIHWEILTRQ